jgi:hypothetical protein
MTNPTSNFNWQMPTPTDLVTDLPADFEVFGQAVDSSMADLLGGTTGQILAKASNSNMDFAWITNDVGDITAVNVTSPITGGGSSGAVTIGINAATTSVVGAVQLSDSTSTTSSVLASTPTATKAAYDLADAAIAKSTVTTAGDIIYRNATVPVRLGIGTAGQVLTVNTGATAPEWKTASGGKIVQVVSGTTRTAVASSSNVFADTGITATITPTSASNKIAVFVVVATVFKQTNDTSANFKLLRGATTIADMANINYTGGATPAIMTAVPINFVDSPATTSATTYKVQFNSNSNNDKITVQFTGATDSSIILMEVTP